MNNLAPMKNFSWGMQGNLNWMPAYKGVCPLIAYCVHLNLLNQPPL